MTELVAEHITWPLKRGDTLSNHDWWPFYGHQFLGSDFLAECVMEGRREALGTALILWSEAMRQDPAGTLPIADRSLASLARLSSIDDWLEVREHVLHGWVEVSVECDHGEAEVRLGHPGMILGVVEYMHKRKRGRDSAREAQRLAVKKTRIRKKLAECRYPKHFADDDRVIAELANYFENSDLYVTPDNLRTAMIEAIGYTGDVTLFPGRSGGG